MKRLFACNSAISQVTNSKKSALSIYILNVYLIEIILKTEILYFIYAKNGELKIIF